MTIEDKRKELKAICQNGSGCTECPIKPVADQLGGCFITYGEERYIDTVYRLLHGSNTTDTVNHPAHYQGAHECITVMEAMFGREAVKAFCKCNAFKYRFRADKKNGAEDIKKAEWYEDYLIKMERKEANGQKG